MAGDYYSTCPFPKTMGEPKKKKKKQNGYKDKPFRKCIYTGMAAAERHEVYPGPNRQTSIEMGFQIDVCPAIHYAIQYGTTEWALQERKKWQQHFQKMQEQKYMEKGMSRSQARYAWMSLMGRNYLDDV